MGLPKADGRGAGPVKSGDDTIVAIATAFAESGLGIVRLSGPLAVEIVRRHFQPLKGGSLITAESHTCHVGRFAADRPIDHVVVTLFRMPHSYTGEDVVEISAHGSPYILDQLLRQCIRSGARLAEPGEFTQRAFVNGKLDLVQAEAVAELIRAKSDTAHQAALAQLEGRLSAHVRSLRDQLVPLLAHVEVGLDHSDEHHEFLSRSALTERCRQVVSQIDLLLASASTSKILREGLRVALVGRPNVGKSSLLNALLREERAIVTPIPGTTRDTLEESVNWDGVPVVITDTAGLRPNANDPVESLGIARTKQAVERADLLLGLFDASEPLTEEDETVIRLCANRRHVWIMNKTDLPSRWTPEALAARNGGAPVIRLSAATGQGVESLVGCVKEAALATKSNLGEAQWLLNARHQTALERAREALHQAAAASADETFEECIAMELHTALKALGEVIGETTTEELLGEVFSQFCVGK